MLKLRRRLEIFLFSAISFTLFSLFVLSTDTLASENYHLSNGMQVILKENHASPMVASVIFVESGSKYEAAYENGITHFLEHLLFDGTGNLDREELEMAISNLGGYNNAFTRKDLTAYLVLLPKEFYRFGLTLQADMLFNSIFPEEEFAKERKVVIEEINRSLDNPSYAVEAFFTEHAYTRTPYLRPVLGHASFIENIPRQAVIDYWKRYYRPERMTLLLIGDFESDEARAIVDDVFGAAVGSDAPDSVVGKTVSDAKPARLSGRYRFNTVADVSAAYVNFSIGGPKFDDSGYAAFDLLSRYLGMDEVSSLWQAIRGGESPLATELSVGLVTRPEFTRMEISVITDRPEMVDAIVDSVTACLADLNEFSFESKIVTGIQVDRRCRDIYNSEKLHYYGFMIAPLMSLGYDFIEQYGGRFNVVTAEQCRAAAVYWLSDPDYVVTTVSPADDSAAVQYLPAVTSSEEVIAYFDSAALASVDLPKPLSLAYPVIDAIELHIEDRATYHRAVFDNGLTILIKSNPDSKVFAMNVLGKDRTLREADGKAGITDFVNHCIEKATTDRDGKRLAADLSAIGANVTLYDNPWIPYDDLYTTRHFSFMKFETIDEFASQGMELFSDMVLNPRFDSVDVASVRRGLVDQLKRAAKSPSGMARKRFFEKLYDSQAGGRPVEGSVESISSITIDDLREHHRQFYAPDNLIISIATSYAVDTVLEWLKAYFGQSAPAKMPPLATESLTSPVKVETDHIELDSKQVGIYIGSSLPGAASDDAVSVAMAASILSYRLYSSLRERKGLAYSVGAGAGFGPESGWYYCRMSTSPDKANDAIDGILLEMDKLRLDGPTKAEVLRARNRTWGRLMSAKLSRINQAYYMALNEYLGRSYIYDHDFLSRLQKIDAREVRRIASRYFNPSAHFLITAGPGE